MKKIFFVVLFLGLLFIAFDNGKNSLSNNETTTGDIGTDSYIFKEVTGLNKIVLFDNTGLEYTRYIVYDFSGSQYVKWSYYYMGSLDKYITMYTDCVSQIVDYNKNEFMIKTIDEINYGTYDSVYEYLKPYLDSSELYLID